jgi:hypothetical protein
MLQILPKENSKKAPIEIKQSLESEFEYSPSKNLEDTSSSASKINTSKKTIKRKIELQTPTSEKKKITHDRGIGFMTSAIEQLREISNRASEVTINKHDSYDYFGMYIASMLRSIGSPRAIQLQQNITNMITNAICQPECITTDNSMSGTTS